MKQIYKQEIKIRTKSLSAEERNNTTDGEEKYKDTFRKNGRIEFRMNAMAEEIDSGKVLDIGCKWGIFYQSIKDKDVEYTGLDFLKENLDLAKREAPECEFIQGDAYKLPFEENTFDYVIMGEIIEHFENPGQALREARRVLKPGGKLIGTTPNATEIIRILKAIFKYTEGSVAHLVLFGKSELEMILNYVGFSKVNVKFIYFNHLRTNRNKDHKFLGALFPHFKRNLLFIAVK